MDINPGDKVLVALYVAEVRRGKDVTTYKVREYEHPTGDYLIVEEDAVREVVGRCKN